MMTDPQEQIVIEAWRRAGTGLDIIAFRAGYKACLAAREDTKQPEELHEEMLDLLEGAMWAVGVNPLAGKIQAILLKYGR